MITEEKLKIYNKYNGLVGAYIFENGDLPDEVFEINDWNLIDELIGNIILLQSGQAATSLQVQLQQFIEDNTDGENVVNYLMKMAKKRIQQGGNVS